MSVQATEQTLHSYLDTLLSRGDFSRFFADDVVWTTMETGDQIRGRKAVADFIIALHTQFFDARPELKTTVVSDGVALIEADFVGTHTAEFVGIGPTGLTVRIPYCVVYDIPGDTITALRVYFPITLLTQQLSQAVSISA
jgi:ketosteroid isomerase-like protein